MNDLNLKYSGPGSKQFWDRVNKLNKRHGELYSLGCVLQNVEHSVIQHLQNAEAEEAFKKFKKKRKSR